MLRGTVVWLQILLLPALYKEAVEKQEYASFVSLTSGLILYFTIRYVRFRRSLTRDHLTFIEFIHNWWSCFVEQKQTKKYIVPWVQFRKKLTTRERINRYFFLSLASYGKWKRFAKTFENTQMEPGRFSPILFGTADGIRFQIEQDKTRVIYHLFFQNSLQLNLVIARFSIIKSMKNCGVVENASDFLQVENSYRISVKSHIDFANWLTQKKCEVLEWAINRFSNVIITDTLVEIYDDDDLYSAPDIADFRGMIVCMKTLQQLFKNTLPDMSPNSKIGAKPIPPKKIYDGPATENPQNLREQKTVRRVIALRKP